jgi:tRNA (5-methylaminomethyl-2-thiouridylate)-methyltransferase (EC 2.1.1.61)
VLWGLGQENLAKTIFPLGDYHKTEIFELAKEWGYHQLAGKSESYEICFIPDNDYRGFLKRKVDGLEERVNGGDFILSDGTVVGKHQGYPFYTVGQRKGLGIALGYPVYVTEIRPETNTIVVGPAEELKSRGMRIRNVNFIKYPGLSETVEGVSAIRANHEGAMSQIRQTGDDEVEVIFYHGVDAIAPGQSAVFYEGDDVIGGGHIAESFDVEQPSTQEAEAASTQ